MKRIYPILITALTLAVSACTPSGTLNEGGAASSLPTEDSGVTVSEEVSYSGIVEPLGQSTSSEGTHRLDFGGGQYLLLQSSVVDLESYEGEQVRVTGTLRRTLDDSDDIMSVTRVEAILVESSSSSSEESSSSAESSLSSEAASSLAPPSPSSSSSSQAAVTSSAAASSVQTSQGASLTPEAKDMSNAKMDTTLWTQQYCTGHIGFCVPIHKNWWFKSFGTTASYLWHVEVSTKDIESMGEGPLQINFENGPIPGGASDGAVVTSGDSVIGYRAWTGGRHFAIVAPSGMRDAVAYMTANLTTYDQTGQ